MLKWHLMIQFLGFSLRTVIRLLIGLIGILIRGGSFVLPGENSPGHFDYATDESRNPPKSLIQVVLKIHSEGCCLESLNSDNIRVYPSGEVKLKNVTLLGLQDLGGVQALMNMQRTNFLNVSQIIRNFFTFQGNTVPPDIRQLLHLISHHNWLDRCIYAIHPSLAPLVSFSAIFKEYKDYIDSKVSDAEYHTICAAIIEDFHGNDCHTLVSGNSLLMETYNFKNLSRTYRVPHNAQGQVQITAAQLAALAEVNLVSSDPTGLTAFEVDVIDGHKLLTFLRNRHAHRREALDAGRKTWNPQRLDYSTSSSELVVRVRFGRVVGVIQFHLNRMGHHCHLMHITGLV